MTYPEKSLSGHPNATRNNSMLKQILNDNHCRVWHFVR